jgi:hypothetical protein
MYLDKKKLPEFQIFGIDLKVFIDIFVCDPSWPWDII